MDRTGERKVVDGEVLVSLKPALKKEVNRVFLFLSEFQCQRNYESKYEELERCKSRGRRRTTALKKESTAKIGEDTKNDIIDDVNSKKLEEQLKKEIENIRKGMHSRAAKNSGRISTGDLYDAINSLGVTLQKREVEEIIWEVNDDIDGQVSWEEFLTMFERNMVDKYSIEPSRLFHIALFLTCDKDCSGTVSVDEVMEILFTRYGKEKLESKVKHLFGPNTEASLTLQQFLVAMEELTFSHK